MSAFIEYLKTDEKIRISEEQLEAIMSEKNTVVSAGAGSGKTTVLSYRFLRLVMDGKAEPDEILTLTFTRKAALEMLSRIREKLTSSPVSGKSDKVTSDAICTLDSFSDKIARAGSVKYGISRSFTISDEQSEEKRLERLSEAFLRDADNEKEATALSALFNSENLKGSFFKPLVKGSVLTETCDSVLLYDQLKAEYTAMRMAIKSLPDKIGGDGDSRDIKTQSDVKELLERIEENEEVSEKEVSKLTCRKAFRGRDDLKKELEKYYILSKALRCPREKWEILQSAVFKFVRLLNEDKRRTGALTYADVSAMAVDILKTNKDVRSYYKKRFKYIMIDEFQDNNEQQRDLLFLLAEKENCFSGTSIPDISTLCDSKLFFVGDEKQSIYRFRGADVSVFRKLQDEIIGAGGNALKLSSNYRSDGALVDYFNSSYKSVFGSAVNLFEARYEETKTVRAKEGGTVRLAHLVRNNLDGQDADEVEADYIGSLVERMLTSDEFLIKDSAGEGRRRPEAGDIAILVRKSDGIQQNIEKALKNRGVEYQLSETRSLMGEAVSSDFYYLLQLMIFPKDKFAETAVLRSPFVRLSDLGLSRWADGEAQEGSDREKYESWLDFKARLEKVAFSLPLPSLLEFIWIEGGYASFILESVNYRDFEEHYEYLYSYAVSYYQSGRGLVEFVSFLRNNLGSHDKLPETTVLHLEKKGVQIMTIHKSKGLEFPIVIVAGTGSGGGRDVSTYLFKNGGKFFLSPLKEVSKLYFDNNEREDAETKRLLYVAETRAEDHLVLTGSWRYNTKDNLPDGRTGELLNMIIAKTGYSILTRATKLENIIIEEITPLDEKFKKKLELTDWHKLDAKYSSYAAPTFKSEPHRLSVTSLEALSEEEGTLLPSLSVDPIIARYSAWTDFGTLAHLVLEKAVKGESLSDISCSIAQSEGENKALLEEALSLKDTFFKSRLWSFVKDAEKECELRFYTYYPPSDAALEGVADLVVFLDDYILVIDYKTDASRREDAHKIQLTAYVRALEEIYGRRCLGTICYLRELTPEPFIDKDGNKLKVL